jgi:hypothetical protein
MKRNDVPVIFEINTEQYHFLLMDQFVVEWKYMFEWMGIIFGIFHSEQYVFGMLDSFVVIRISVDWDTLTTKNMIKECSITNDLLLKVRKTIIEYNIFLSSHLLYFCLFLLQSFLYLQNQSWLVYFSLLIHSLNQLIIHMHWRFSVSFLFTLDDTEKTDIS